MDVEAAESTVAMASATGTKFLYRDLLSEGFNRKDRLGDQYGKGNLAVNSRTRSRT